MADIKLKKAITNSFKLNGLTLRSDASRYMQDLLSTINSEGRDECINKIIEGILKQSLSNSVIEKQQCEASVAELNHTEEDVRLDLLSVVDAFDVPNYVFDMEAKKFKLSTKPRSLLADASDKIYLFVERYNVIYQRTLRHERFISLSNQSEINKETAKEKFQLRPVEYLIGSSSALTDIVVLGMLSQLKEGQWFLEDPTGCIKLDLSHTQFHLGLFTENCFVVATGSCDDNIFHVTALGFPPPEPSTLSKKYLGNINLFGPSTEACKQLQKLKAAEEENEDAMMVVLSDVWLDDKKVMQKLRVLFGGYMTNPPTCFIICGDFLFKSYGQNHLNVLKDHFKVLTDLLLEHPRLVQVCKFFFIAGPRDPCFSTILPKPPLSLKIQQVVTSKIPNASFLSNPARIRFCSKEIVVFRENLLHKMCKNVVTHPEGDLNSHFTKTITSQNHLCPLPLNVEPVHWSFDAALRIYPLPDLLVCADWTDPYSINQLNCCVANPGSFPRTDFSFKVYWPILNKVEDSKIPEDF